MLSVSIAAAPPAAVDTLDALALIVISNSEKTTAAEVHRQIAAINGYDFKRQAIAKRVNKLQLAGLLVRSDRNARVVEYSISELGEQTLASWLQFYETLATLA